MKKPRPYLAIFIHGLKVWLFMMVTFVPLSLVAQYMPRWLFVIVFFCYAIFVFFPVVFGIGPIGRLIGRQLNESAVAQARAERESLRPTSNAEEFKNS
jgi:hypothetical protein